MNKLQEAINTIKRTRDIKPSTLLNYERYLLYIYRIVKNKSKTEIKNISDIKEYKWVSDPQIIEILRKNTNSKTSLRGYLNCLNVVLQAMSVEENRDMIDLLRYEIKQINTYTSQEDSLQLKNEKQEKNWLSWKEVKDIYKILKHRYELIKRDPVVSPEDMDFVRNFTILSCYVLFPPRRTQDYVLYYVDDGMEETLNESDFKFSDLMMEDSILTQNNYLYRTEDNKFYFIFNNYKTSSTYGSQKFPLSYALSRIFVYWLKINKQRIKNEFFENYEDASKVPAVFLNSLGNPMTSQNIGITLTNIFKKYANKNISASLLRHIYISNFMKGSKPLRDRLQLASKMSHSIEVQEGVYRKLEGKEEDTQKKKYLSM